MKTSSVSLVSSSFVIIPMAIAISSIIMLTACDPTPPKPTATPTDVSTVTTSPSPTATYTAIPSATPSPTSTRVPLPTPTPSPTHYPTLESEAKLEFIVKMLRNNGGCKLPCWWGITPGKTKWHELTAYFTAQGIGLTEEGQLELGYANKQKHHVETLDVGFRQQDDLVHSIEITAEYYYLLSQEGFAPAWQGYTLSQMLSNHGTPSRIHLDLGLGNVDRYNLWLIYGNLGMAIRYSGEIIRDNSGWLVCPVFSTADGIEIRLQSPNIDRPLVEFEHRELSSGFQGELTELTGMSLQQFHATFSQFPPQDCLLVPDPSPWWYDELILPPDSVTLSHTQEDTLIVRLLADSAGCELPCWWGITPGVTSWQDARRMFLARGKSVSNQPTTDLGMKHLVDLFGRHSPYPFDYVIHHQLYERDGIVYLLGVTGYAIGWSPPQHFTQDWQQYSLDRVLARFGTPTEVLLHYWDYGLRYTVGVVYEDLGILIKYSGQIPGYEPGRSESPILICPTQNRPTAIGIWLTQPGSGFLITDAFARLGYGYPYSLHFSSTPSLQEATGMSVDTFYVTYLNSDSLVCLKAPRNLGDMAP